MAPLNADKIAYGVAPAEKSSFNGGPLHVGNKMEVTVGGKIIWVGPIGDFGKKPTIEFSVRAASDSGIRSVIGRHGEGPMPSLNGRTTPDIPATATYYPGIAP